MIDASTIIFLVVSLFLFIVIVFLFAKIAILRQQLSIPVLTLNSRTSTQPSTVKAYSVVINVEATRMLQSEVVVVNVFNQLGQCISNQSSFSKKVKEGTFRANWIVIRGPSGSSGGPILYSDVLSNNTKYLMIGPGTHIVIGAPRSIAENNARSQTLTSTRTDDIFLLVTSLSSFNAMFKDTDTTTCPPQSRLSVNVNAPFNSMSTTSIVDNLYNLMVTTDYYAHAWGYSFGKSGTTMTVE